MRVVVIGTSGSGKSTLADRIGARFDVPVVELDALNWRPGWEARSLSDPPGFLIDVDAATSGPGWVVSGNYMMAHHIVWARATHLVWLDYSRAAIMARVLRRSFWRALRRDTVWGGNRESFRLWLDPGHPVQWAWRSWQANRTATIARLSDPAAAHLSIIQVRRPGDAPKVLERLAFAQNGSVR